MSLRHTVISMILLTAFIIWPLGRAAFAETPKPAVSATEAETVGKPDGTKPLEGTVEKASVTHHQIVVNGQTIKYRATAANMPMKDENGKLKATVFFVAYEKETLSDQAAATQTAAASTGPANVSSTQPACKDPEHRPITFLFNGGPGAAAVWLHLGAAGPRRVALREDGQTLPPPYHLEENSSTWLDATDLVFIDPIGTGFSRPAEGEKGKQFYGVNEDLVWVAEFIRLYITTYSRWLSPKFLAGESYGTIRAAGLSKYFLNHNSSGIVLNGIVFISAALEMQAIGFEDGNDLPYWLVLPSYTASAWYHKKLPPDLQADLAATLKQVESWAASTYNAALGRGLSLSAEERQDVIAHLARYTGLPPVVIDRCNLRVNPWVFAKELLRDSRRLVGLHDARITSYDPNPESDRLMRINPAMSLYSSVYGNTFNDYVRRTLKYDSILPYEVIAHSISWPIETEGDGYLSFVRNLQEAMVKNPDMRVLFASGYQDLVTPYFATTHTIDHLDVGPDCRGRITHTLYEGGHMMYHCRASLAGLKNDVAAFIRAAVPPPQEHE